MYTKQIIKIFERYSSKSLILKMLGLSYCLCLSFLIAGSVVSASTPLVEWEKTFGGKTDDWGRSVYQTSDGGYIIAGYTLTRGGDIWLIKLDSKGNEEWDKNLGDMDWSEEEVYAVQQTKDGGYIVTGKICHESIQGENCDVYVFKISSKESAGSTESPATTPSTVKTPPDITPTMTATETQTPPEKSVSGFEILSALLALLVITAMRRGKR